MKKRRPGPRERRQQAGRITTALRRVSRPAGDDDWLARGTLTILIVKHDEWCASFTGRACTCGPDLELRRVTQATLDHPAEPGQG